jgi:hypothetical protein
MDKNKGITFPYFLLVGRIWMVLSGIVAGGQVKSYIRSQKQHHLKLSFIYECRRLLDENSIDYEERYL